MKPIHLFVLALLAFVLFSSNKCTIKKGVNDLPEKPAVSSPAPLEYKSFPNDPYADMWREVQQLFDEGKYKSAHDLVVKIDERATKDKNEPEIVRALFAKFNLAKSFQEDAEFSSITEIEKRILSSFGAQKALLHMLAGRLYWSYYSINRYKISSRTKTIDFKQDDFRTWDANSFMEKIEAHFIQVVNSLEDLKKYNISDFAPILKNTDQNPHLVQTLFDLANIEVMSFFRSAMSMSNNVEYNAYLLSLFSFPEDFMQDDLVLVQDKNKRIILQRYQDLMKTYHSAKDWDKFVYWDIERLKYLNDQTAAHGSSQLYKDALSHIIQSDLSSNEVAMAYALLSNEILKSEKTINTDGNTPPKVRVKQLCQTALLKFDTTAIGVKHCKQIIQHIENKQLSFTIERTVKPNQESLLEIEYQNISEVGLKLIKMPIQTDALMPFSISSLDFINHKPVLEWNIKLRDFGDYESHSLTTTIPKLDYGRYVLVVFNLNDTTSGIPLYHKDFFVSDMVLMSAQGNKSNNFMVLDAYSGKPMSNVVVRVYEDNYDYKQRQYNYRLKSDLRTKKDGVAKVDLSHSGNHIVLLINGTDSLYSERYYLSNYRKEKEKEITQAQIFIDRGIYRPGQEVFFKGVCFSGKDNDFKVVANKKGSIELYDVNHKVIASFDYVTNEYGSYSGSFRLPIGALNGSFSLRDKTFKSQKYFNVEEYKRPKFEVTTLPLAGEYKFNEEIVVRGEAKAYSGQVLDGAKVTYRITESVSFPRWGRFGRSYMPQSDEKQIDFGEVTTDKLGGFEIKFVAKSNPQLAKMPYATLNYNVSIDVLDITGETQSTSQRVSVANYAMNLKMNFDEVLDVNSFKQFEILANNLNNVPVKTKGTIEIIALEEPKQVRRDAHNFKADYYQLDSAAWSEKFPHLDFYNLNDPYELKELQVFAKINFDTEKSTQVKLPATSKLKPGRYKVKARAKDKFGVEVFDETIFIVHDKNAKDSPVNKMCYTALVSTNHEPGNDLEFLIASGLNDFTFLIEVSDRTGIIHEERISISKGQHLFKFPISEKHRGGLLLNLTAYRWGKPYKVEHQIVVPFSNKELNLKFETFRNKLEPGAQEQWKMTVSGKFGDLVAAELVASLYDASLDQFASNQFDLWPFSSGVQRDRWQVRTQQVVKSQPYRNYRIIPLPNLGYRVLSSFNFAYFAANQNNFDAMTYYDQNGLLELDDEILFYSPQVASQSFNNGYLRMDKISEQSQTIVLADMYLESDIDVSNSNKPQAPQGQPRTNLNETAFFFPHLQTNNKGEIVLSFTMPEALTRWKFISLAHTKEMRIGTLSDYTMTQKELMIQPNPPRFLREGDTLSFVAKVSNLSEQVMTGFAALELFDARTMEPLNVQFKLKDNKQMFALEKGANASVYWDIVVPIGVEAVIYRVSADAGNFVDGEENMLPILSNRMLVIETLPLPSKGVGTRNFRLEKLWNSGAGKSIQHHSLTLEYTSNPAWYAVQAIPYLMEYPHECAEQLFSRYYANALATHIMQANPKIKEVFEKWENETPETLLSNLEKNQELKYILLNETPWVMQAQNENERKKRIATLFNFSKMERELDATMRKLQQMQSPNGGFPWFKGMPDNPYITKHIVMGAGHLDRLGVKAIKGDKAVYEMFKKAVKYMDERFYEQYLEQLKYKRDFEKDELIHFGDVQYLYARSFFNEIPMSDKMKPVRDLYLNQMVKYKNKFSLQGRAMAALCLHRFDLKKEAKDIVAALKNIALISDEMGMYWKDNVSGYYWYQAPIETQAIMIEAFDEITNDIEAVEEMKVWLLKNKQTNDWKTTKATTMAVYALFMRGTDLLSDDDIVDIYIGDRDIKRFSEDFKTEAGTGYFKHTFNSEEIQPIYGDVRVVRKKPGVSWGALYWQYFEDLDKITPSETPLKLKKQLFVVRNSPTGEVMMPIGNNAPLKPGDKIRVRIELRSDRDMEFVHMKDMRAAGFEPVNVISRYKYQGGIGYYESTKDASTDFFIDFLRKGIYVFEYDMRANLKGQFANGITTIQCMYAPEFTSHSEGVRVRVD